MDELTDSQNEAMALDGLTDAQKEAFQLQIELEDRYRDHNSEIQEEALARRQPPYQTYEEIGAAKYIQWVGTAPDTMSRLFWTFNGPLATAIGVFENGDNDSNQTCVPFYNESNGTWHPISTMAVSEPRVSSITVHVNELSDWETSWEELHWEHWENDAPSEEELKIAQDGGTAKPAEYGCDLAEWGVLKQPSRGGNGSDDVEDDALGHIQVIACCGIPRPVDKDATIVVRPSNMDGPDGGYVTVHDYVTTVHPWVMGLRGEILTAMGEGQGNFTPLPGDTSLMFAGHALDSMYIDTIKDHLHFRKIAPEMVARFTVGQDVTYDTGQAADSQDLLLAMMEAEARGV